MRARTFLQPATGLRHGQVHVEASVEELVRGLPLSIHSSLALATILVQSNHVAPNVAPASSSSTWSSGSGPHLSIETCSYYIMSQAAGTAPIEVT